MRWDTDISDAALEIAQKMRLAGASWEKIERATGSTMHIIRSRIDPGYRERRNFNSCTGRDYRREREADRVRRLTPKEALHALATVPVDTRSRTSRMMGDPLPGRSALDQKLSTVHVAGWKPEVSLDPVVLMLSIEDHHSNSEVVE